MDMNDDQRFLIHENAINGIVMSNVISAFKQVSDGLLIAFDTCESNDRPLTDLQKADIMQCVFFCLRDIESEMKGHAQFTIQITKMANDDPDFVRELMNIEEDDDNA